MCFVIDYNSFVLIFFAETITIIIQKSKCNINKKSKCLQLNLKKSVTRNFDCELETKRLKIKCCHVLGGPVPKRLQWLSWNFVQKFKKRCRTKANYSGFLFLKNKFEPKHCVFMKNILKSIFSKPMKDNKNADTHLFLLLFTTSQHRRKLNKESHWFQVSGSKLLEG